MKLRNTVILFMLCSGVIVGSQTVEEVLQKHAGFVRQVQSCDKRNWPIGDAACEGTALGIAHSYVLEHPDWFGPHALDKKP